MLRHGYFPKSIRDCVLIPVPKHGKDISHSESYRAIALASNISKVFEWCMLLQYPQCLQTSRVGLQFGFKSGMSTSLCTGTIKAVTSRYIHKNTPVYSCFLDASKAFDLVNHDLLFQSLLDKGMPACVVRFLRNWYCNQRLSVKWNSEKSDLGFFSVE